MAGSGVGNDKLTTPQRRRMRGSGLCFWMTNTWLVTFSKLRERPDWPSWRSHRLGRAERKQVEGSLFCRMPRAQRVTGAQTCPPR